MTTFPNFVLLHIACFVVIAATDKLKTKPDNQEAKQEHTFFTTNDGTMGVASVSGITSRNGRVSSIGEIKFFPANGSPITAKTGETTKFIYPLSESNDGKFASGMIQINPGSMTVSSSAKSGYMPEAESWASSQVNNWPTDKMDPWPLQKVNSWPTAEVSPWTPNKANSWQLGKINTLQSDKTSAWLPNKVNSWPAAKPVVNKVFLQPSSQMFETPRTLDPWFNNDIIFENLSPPRTNALRTGWMYPSFNPFVNFWR